MFIKKEAEEDSPEYFRCPDCQFICGSKTSLNLHSAVHADACAKTCNICGETYSNEEDLAEHLVNHETIKINENSDLTCLSCNETFWTRVELDEHLKVHRLTCDTCPRVFEDEEDLEKHYKIEHQRQSFQCSLCFIFLKSRDTLRNHINETHQSNTSFTCEVCFRSFVSKSQLSHHLKNHVNYKSFKCTQCSKAFSYKFSLISHLLKHAGETPYECFVCTRKFSDRRYFRIHGQKHLFEPGQGQSCTLCGKEFPNKGRLNFHLRIHSDVRTFVCKECGAGFNYITQFKYHMNKHKKNPTKDLSKNAKKKTNEELEKLQNGEQEKVLTEESIVEPKKRPKRKRKKKPKEEPNESERIKKKLHQCELCSVRCRYPSELKRHFLSHLKKTKRTNSTL